jgi:hypothetical protein
MISTEYIIDTSCLTQAHRVYYPFDIAPSYWDFMKYHFNNGQFLLTNKVAFEIIKGNDELTNWMQNNIPASLEIDCHTDANIMTQYGNIMNWGSGNSQFKSIAKTELADFDNADPFVVASAISKQAFVVSQETSAPNSEKRIKLPDICTEFQITHIDTYTLLRAFGFKM